jgi:hypothetical protein
MILVCRSLNFQDFWFSRMIGGNVTIDSVTIRVVEYAAALDELLSPYHIIISVSPAKKLENHCFKEI